MMPDLGYITAVRFGLVLFLLAGCPRDAADPVCPDIAAGDLVITEIGGPQTGMETLRPFIEVFNASGTEIDLVTNHGR